MKEGNEGKHVTEGSWLERVAVAPEAIAWWLDGVRWSFLEAENYFAATRASIFLVTLLAWSGREEDIRTVVDDLRWAVRAAGRHGELVFVLYSLTNAVARGEDLEEALEEALARLRRCEGNLKTDRVSGADEGAGLSERRSSMETQQMEQDLKSERVQEELTAAAEPYRVSLKAERVQEPALAEIGAVGRSSAFEMTINQKQPVTIELLGLEVVITLHGTEAGAAGLAG